VTKDVPPHALALSRVRQAHITNYPRPQKPEK
jgi:bifunctional N-acetylglucosamine-1-phosphate-uridyltransferase/glucosamine-1-phosphate-acetyltransferase GlmU-like protein